MIVETCLALIVVVLVLILAAAIGANKKIKKSNSTAIEVALEAQKVALTSVHDETLDELNNVIESQKNLILSQRSELNTSIVGINRLKDKLASTESMKKSSEVRLGQIGENFMPFINSYPYDHKNFHFLANPCDGLQIEKDAVIFIEFKTGGAKLSKSQKHIKDLISQGKVRFETFRVDNKGTTLKLESSMSDATE